MDLWAVALRKFILPLYYSRHGDRRFQRLREIERDQWLDKQDLEVLQLNRVNRLLDHAYRTTPFYRQRLDACGIQAGPIGELSDLQAMEPVSKTTLQSNLSAMLSTDYNVDDLIEDASGGSTGIPTKFYKDIERHNLRRADQIRHDRWSGWNVGERWALIWGARTDLVDKRSLRERLVEKYLHRCVALDAFELKHDSMQEFAVRLHRHKPRMILGYANALYRFAEFLLESEFSQSIRPSGVISSAENLTKDMKDLIGRAFACPVLDRYGSREVGLIASECGINAGLHINADNLIVEIVNGDLPAASGQTGQIIVTDLWNYGMPLIRYDMGDMGIPTDALCPCGRKLPMIQSVEGRASDFLQAADGTQIHGEFFTHLFYGNDAVVQFQIVQKTSSDVDIFIVRKDEYANEQFEEIVATTKRVLGETTKVTVKFRDSIPPTASGKFRFTISNVEKTQEG